MPQKVDNTGWTYGEQSVGTVVRIVQDRGFAFVRANGGETDFFMHHSDYSGEFIRLKVGQVVAFTPAETPKGPRACFVEKSSIR